MRRHRVMLDVDVHPKEEVEREARRLYEKFGLGGFRIEPSYTEMCWRIIYPLTALKWDDAIKVAEDCKLIDPAWLNFCKRYVCFGASTETSRYYQPSVPKPRNEPIDGRIALPVILIVKPATDLDLKRVVKLSQNLEDELWQWRVRYPLAGIYGGTSVIVEIGCRDMQQANRRINFIKKLKIECEFEVAE